MNRSLQAFAALVAAVALTGQAPSPAPTAQVAATASTDEASQLFARSAAQVAALKSYSSALHVDFGMRTFPYLKFHVEGDTTYVKPDDFSVHFQHVPWFAKGFEHMKMDAIEPQNWPRLYVVDTVAHKGDRTIVEMHLKTPGNLKGVHAEFDASGLRRVDWTYLNGGHITVQLTPTVIDGVSVPASESADIRVPGYHVTASATFTNYAIVKDSHSSVGSAASAPL
jgi:hypothetical protein